MITAIIIIVLICVSFCLYMIYKCYKGTEPLPKPCAKIIETNKDSFRKSTDRHYLSTLKNNVGNYSSPYVKRRPDSYVDTPSNNSGTSYFSDGGTSIIESITDFSRESSSHSTPHDYGGGGDFGGGGSTDSWGSSDSGSSSYDSSSSND